ncbi:hypothetical protein [Bradyrhizobium sp.]|uniref:hypothetical protein n=1 Tax=Bradyrhizobium sp. TaxID=376 RepID=UPI0039E6E231
MDSDLATSLSEAARFQTFPDGRAFVEQKCHLGGGGTVMRASSLIYGALAAAVISLAPANAQKTTPNTTDPVKREKPLRQAKAQAPAQVYCKASFPCRAVMKGCHLEHNGPGGFNEEVCN